MMRLYSDVSNPVPRSGAWETSFSELEFEETRLRRAWVLVALTFLVSLALHDWPRGFQVRNLISSFALPAFTIIAPLYSLVDRANWTQRACTVQAMVAPRFILLLLWFAIAICLQLLFESPYAVPASAQKGAYVSCAQLLSWTIAGYCVVERRQQGMWLLHRLAVGMACISGLVLFLIVIGQWEVLSYATPEYVELAAPIAPKGLFGNTLMWGVQGFLLFGYCWFLTLTLTHARWLTWSAVGLFASSVLWLLMEKATIFGISAGTVAIVVTLLLCKGYWKRVMLRGAVSLGVVVVVFMVLDADSQGRLSYRVSNYLAAKFFRVKELSLVTFSARSAVTASTLRMDVIWPKAIERFEASPWCGSGFNQNFVEHFTFSTYVPIHNAYLDILVGVGIVGTLPVLLAFLWWLKTVGKAVRQPENMLLLLPCFGYSICFCVMNAGDLLRYFYTPIMLFGLIVGISMKIALMPAEQDRDKGHLLSGEDPCMSCR